MEMLTKNNFIFMITFILATICGYVSSGALPADITKCKADDNTCIADKMNEIIQKYPKGNKDFGLTDISNISVPKFLVGRSTANAPVQLNFELIDAFFTGLEKAKILSVKGFNEHPKEISVQLIVPEVHLTGKYTIDGKILLLPIRGKGDGSIILRDSDVTTTVRVIVESRDGKNYLKITKSDISVTPKGFNLYLGNLFDGDKELTDITLKTINENWELIWDDLKDDISALIDNIFHNLLTPVLASISFDDFYAE